MNRKAWFGAAIWALLGAGLATWSVAAARTAARPLGKLARFAFGSTQRTTVELPGPLRVGDPVLDAERRPVGVVASLPAGENFLPAGRRGPVVLALDPEHPLAPGARFFAHTAPVDAAWVVDTLLPPEKREFVLAELEAFAREHRDALDATLRPLAEDVVQHGLEVFEANLSGALARHDGEIQALLDRHRAMLKEDVLPVLKRELGPSAKQKAQPILEEIGRELWDELPMWSVGWRAVVDTIPGTRQDRTERWWREFLDTKAIPIVAAHEDDLVRALEALIEEGARNEHVRAALGGATRRLAADPDFKRVVRTILEEALVRPFDVGALVRRLFEDPEHRSRLRALQRAFAPTLKRIGRRLTTRPDGGIDPDLARVLRRIVFQKDGRWVEVEAPAKPAPAPARDGAGLRAPAPRGSGSAPAERSF